MLASPVRRKAGCGAAPAAKKLALPTLLKIISPSASQRYAFVAKSLMSKFSLRDHLHLLILVRCVERDMACSSCTAMLYPLYEKVNSNYELPSASSVARADGGGRTHLHDRRQGLHVQDWESESSTYLPGNDR
jgi:hypothetical protein